MTFPLDIPPDVAAKIERQSEGFQRFLLAAAREKLKRREKKERLANPEVKAMNGEAGAILEAWCNGYPKYHNDEEYVVGKHDYKICQGLVGYDRNEVWKRFRRYVQRNGAYYLGHPLSKFKWNEYADAEWTRHEANLTAIAKKNANQPIAAVRRSTVTCPDCGQEGVNMQTHRLVCPKLTKEQP